MLQFVCFGVIVVVYAVWSAVGVSGAPITYPEDVYPDPTTKITSLTLNVVAQRITIADAVTFTTRLYQYNSKTTFPGPTIHAVPGGTIRLTLVNQLESSAAYDDVTPMNRMRNSNQTNMHTHGLHVSPEIDTIFKHLLPGESHTYVYEIPSDHAPGMHWYHSHVHGASTMHIMGGKFGAIIIDPTLAGSVPAAIASLSQSVMLLSRLQFVQTLGKTGLITQDCVNNLDSFDPFKAYTYEELTNETGSKLLANPVFPDGVQKDFMFVNGLLNPDLVMMAGESRLLRVLFATGEGFPALKLLSSLQQAAPASTVCTTSVVAWDGVYLSGAARLQTTVQLVPASRVEIVLTCAGSATVGSKYYLVAQDGPSFFGVMTVTIAAGTPASTTTLGSAALNPVLPTYLRNLQSVTATTTMHLHMSQGGAGNCFKHMGMGTNCDSVDSGTNPSSTLANCNFVPFPGEIGYDPTKHRYVAKVGDVVDVQLHGLGKASHPLHIHVNHFQVISYRTLTNELNFADWLVVGDYHDTVPALDGVMTLRFVADRFAGEIVAHCHILSHEDKGLMGTFLIRNSSDATPSTPSTTTTTTAASSSLSTTKSASAALSRLSLTWCAVPLMIFGGASVVPL